MARYYADAILCHYATLCEHVCYGDVILGLVSGFVVTVQEKQDLDALQVGTTTRCSRLLDLILARKRNLEFFTEVLAQRQKPLAQLIEDERQKIESGERLPHLKVIEQQFKSYYKDSEYQLTEKLPGEDFTLDVSDESLLLPLDVNVDIVDRDFLNKQKRRTKNIQQHFRYKQLQGISIIEKVFSKDVMEEDHRLFVCTGIAGTGKTVTLHRLAWQWANGLNEHLQKFSIFIVIPLSKINSGQTLMEILSSSTDGPGYIDISQRDVIDKVFQRHSKEVVFAIDGADEVQIPPEAELNDLICGRLYPGAKVFIMARPDVHSLAVISDLNPDVKIHINGTSLDGISRYLEASLTSEDTNKDVINKFKKLVLQEEILKIPLYLAMVSVVFDRHCISDASFANFRIPKTTTDLLNSFMCMIIKIWLQRNNRKDEMCNCTFEKSPLENGSKVPVDIRAKLVNMGRMSFECLLDQRYMFSNSDLERYLIHRNDIQSCGMFRLRKSSTEEFCFIHQIFQQYLSAVYLSHMQLKDAVFRDHIYKLTASHPTMEALFSPLELCVKFIFGMCPAFGKKLMETVAPLASYCIFKSNRANPNEAGSLNVQFEAELCRESGDPALVKMVEHFLVQGEHSHVKLDTQLSAYSFETVYTLIARFSEDTCISLLEKIYNLNVSEAKDGKRCISNKFVADQTSPERQVTSTLAEMGFQSRETSGDGICDSPGTILDWEDGWCVLNKLQSQKDHSSSTKGPLHDELFDSLTYPLLIIDNLDVSCYCLLSKFSFPDIQKLVVLDGINLNVDDLSRIFPSIRHFEINCSQNIDAVTSEVCTTEGSEPSETQHNKPCESLVQQIRIDGTDGQATVRLHAASSIFPYKHLKDLSIARLQLFVPSDEYSANHRKLDNLAQLTVSDCSVHKYMDQLCQLLRLAPNLVKLHLHNTSGDMCEKESADLLMSTIAECHKSIQHLALVHIFTNEGVNIMCSFLPQIHSLKRLSLGEWDLMDAMDSILANITKLDLHIYIWHVTRKEIKKKLGPRKFKVSPLSLLNTKRAFNEESSVACHVVPDEIL